MTNHDRADRLLNEAAGIMQEVQPAMQRRSWNLAIRRAQEVVELVLKALLAELGVEYPRVHDVGPQFAAAVRARRLDVDPNVLEWLEAASGKLAVLRAPAFYFEVDYEEDDAAEAVAAAERVMAFGRAFIENLRTR